jgi:hypothetical protein
MGERVAAGLSQNRYVADIQVYLLILHAKWSERGIAMKHDARSAARRQLVFPCLPEPAVDIRYIYELPLTQTANVQRAFA